MILMDMVDVAFDKSAIRMGTDFEGFVFDESGRVWEFPLDSEVTPRTPMRLTDNAWVYPDGMACEIGITPAETAEEFSNTIKDAIAAFKHWLEPQGLAVRYETIEVSCDPYHQPSDWLATREEPVPYREYLRADEWGCSPDFEAWTGDIDSSKSTKRHPGVLTQPMIQRNVRFSGGHVHLQYNHNIAPPPVAARFADLIIGMVQPRDTSLRADIYGWPGVHRPKEYGVEYRSPSSMWLADDESIEAMGRRLYALGWLMNNLSMGDLQMYHKQVRSSGVNMAMRHLTARMSSLLPAHTIRMRDKYVARSMELRQEMMQRVPA
jgi:hypothetical protein